MRAPLSILATILAGPALAGEYCLIDGTKMFSCTFNGGAKSVELCDAIWEGDFRATYGYFAPGQEPELALTNDMTTMTYTAWKGVGQPFGSVTYHSADFAYGYEVWYAGEDGGITLRKGDDTLATLTCDAGSLSHDLDSLIDKIAASQVSP